MKPLFMFGFERSGTTLLSMMVGSHPDIAVPLSTTGLWYAYEKRLAQYDNLRDHKSIKRIIADLLQEERIKMWDEALTEAELVPLIRQNNFSSVVAAFYHLYARQKGKQNWASIDISTLYSMDRANHWFPDARFLHIVRDGRDVALSHETYIYGLSSTTEVAEHWANALHTNMKMGGMLDPCRYLIIHYEALVTEPESTLQQICDFIGLEYSPDMLNYSQMVSEKVPENRRFLWPALSEAPQKSKAFRWKTDMSSAKRIVFEGRANGMLKQLGYDAFEQVPKSLGAYAFDLWCYIGRGGRMKRLKEKFSV